jgi:hypothetical protein
LLQTRAFHTIWIIRQRKNSSNGIYSISIENISPNEEVVVEIQYITELKLASEGELAFVFPNKLWLPVNKLLPNSFYFSITWELPGKIKRIYSLTNDIEVTKGSDEQ